MEIDKSSVIPLYYQLADVLKSKITSHLIKPGETLPSESSLIKEYEISRGTIRQALQLLTQEGLIERYPGRGSFVCPLKINHDAAREMGFYSQSMEDAGKVPSAKILDFIEIPVQKFIQEKLGLNEKDTVIFIKRLRYADDEPVSLENTYFIKDVGQKLYDEDLTGSIYKILQEKYKFVIERSQNSIEATIVDNETANLIGVARNSPILVVRRLVFFPEGKPYEYSKDIFRADKIRFSVDDHYHGETPNFTVKPGSNIESD
jgi:GntR family transcriptional regulator